MQLFFTQRSPVETNNRTTSPMSSFCASTTTTTTTTKTAPALSSVIDDWLIDTVCKAATKDDGSTAKEADYENCLALQQQLASNGLTNEAEEEDDGDYANVSPEASGKSPFTSSCSSTSSGDDESLVMMKGENKAEKPEMSQRREVLLKVMIDPSERNSQGDEVFYIDRSVSFQFPNFAFILTFI